MALPGSINRQEIILEQLPFFVYGSLRTGESHWERLLNGRTSQEIEAILPAHKLYGATYSYIVDSDADWDVMGNLAWLDPAQYNDIVASLDELEGYDAGSDSGPWFRVIREAEYIDEQGQIQRVRAWVYHGNPELLHQMESYVHIVTGDWLKPGL